MEVLHTSVGISVYKSWGAFNFFFSSKLVSQITSPFHNMQLQAADSGEAIFN